ncbi:hypothetical protein L1987_19670 [Smallanthus sonchifolius]|uniref:Uncharacterized protein n=1 Tax=Smallanthus sonchifolius TaxID=185202 RepID=A0ACB9IRC2_9ASTR|nr:hypothetical protein L1987_19670 [Smallanthus sonchifolius]
MFRTNACVPHSAPRAVTGLCHTTLTPHARCTESAAPCGSTAPPRLCGSTRQGLEKGRFSETLDAATAKDGF